MERLGDRSIRDSLPLPVARLWRRARNAKSAKDRHDSAYFAWEVSVRVGVAARPPSDPAELARGSVGVWAAALDGADRGIAESSLIEAHAAWTRVVAPGSRPREHVRLGDVVNVLAAYRNKVIGHGSVREDAFYAEQGARLQESLEVAWRAGLFLPESARIVFVDVVELTTSGESRARVLEISGDAPIVVDPKGVFVPASVLPKRLYLRTTSGWEPLHPWLLYDDQDERVWCFNGFGRRAEFLDYASGETLTAPAIDVAYPGTTAALKSLLGGAPRTTDAPASDIPEDRRFGDYEVLGKLGQGGMGAVYLARQRSLGRLVALKMLPEERARDGVALARFRREIRALARCDHPNVVKILASGETRGTHYYAMEYVDGADLSRVSRAMSGSVDFDTAVSSACDAARSERKELFPDLPPVPRRNATPLHGDDRHRQVARFFAQAAEGLHHLHEQGILHRDVSPANIMVTWPEERAVIMDLGLAGIADASVSLTKDGSRLLGTLRYLAPERLRQQSERVDRRADVYSLGATLHEILAGAPLFDGDTEARLMHQILHEAPRSPERFPVPVPSGLARVIQHATAKAPSERYETALRFKADLEAWLRGERTTARAPGATDAVRTWVGSHGRIALAVVAGAVAAGSIVWTTSTRGRQVLAEQEELERVRSHALEVLRHSVWLADLPLGDANALADWTARSIDLESRTRELVVGRQPEGTAREVRQAEPAGAADWQTDLARKAILTQVARICDTLRGLGASASSTAGESPARTERVTADEVVGALLGQEDPDTRRSSGGDEEGEAARRLARRLHERPRCTSADPAVHIASWVEALAGCVEVDTSPELRAVLEREMTAVERLVQGLPDGRGVRLAIGMAERLDEARIDCAALTRVLLGTDGIATSEARFRSALVERAVVRGSR